MSGIRYGPLYTRTVIRPIAEQVAAMLQVHAGDRVCEAADIDALGLLPDASCDVFVNVLTAGRRAHDVANAARRIVGSGGRIAIAVWDSEQPPLHERVLLEALRAIGAGTAPVTARLSDVASVQMETTTLQDVARFDGFAQYWAALVGERETYDQPLEVAASARASLMVACEREIARHAAADGTLRIPVRATLLRAGLSPR